MADDIKCIDAEKYLEVIREMIQHENQLLNYRLTWMCALQGLLFSATGLLWPHGFLPVFVIAVVGSLACVSIGYSTKRGMDAVSMLLKNGFKYKEELNTDRKFPPIIGTEVEEGEKECKDKKWLQPGHALPRIMGVAWCALLIVFLIV